MEVNGGASGRQGRVERTVISSTPCDDVEIHEPHDRMMKLLRGRFLTISVVGSFLSSHVVSCLSPPLTS
jgi:hypothetical protein